MSSTNLRPTFTFDQARLEPLREVPILPRGTITRFFRLKGAPS